MRTSENVYIDDNRTEKTMEFFLSILQHMQGSQWQRNSPAPVCLVWRALKGHALTENTGARMDFSYVPGHLGEF